LRDSAPVNGVDAKKRTPISALEAIVFKDVFIVLGEDFVKYTA